MGHPNILNFLYQSHGSLCSSWSEPQGGWILSLLPVARIPPETPWSSKHLCSPWAFSVMGFLTVGGGHAIQSDPSDYKHVMPYIEGRAPFYTTSRDSSSRYPLKPQERLFIWRSRGWPHLSSFPLKLRWLSQLPCPAQPWGLSWAPPCFSCVMVSSVLVLVTFWMVFVLFYSLLFFTCHKHLPSCKHPIFFFYSRFQEMNLDPMFLGVYPYESNANLWWRWGDSSNKAIHPVSVL